MRRGFGKKPPERFVNFILEIKTRMKDDSELLLGTASLRVPEIKNRQYEKAIAISAATKFLLHGAPKGANQIFIFTSTGRFVDRIELREWEGECEKNILEDEQQSLMDIAYNLCQIELSLLPRPVVA